MREKVERDLLVGLDFGSDSVRALLVDSKGTELADAVCDYPRWTSGLFCDPAVKQFRQHPLDYLEAMENVIVRVLSGIDPGRVAGIGVDSTGSTPCAVDADGIPLALKDEFAANPNAMFILWKDHTACAEAARINAVSRGWGGIDYTMYSGGIYSSEWFWSKILHVLRHDQQVRHAAHHFVELCDWVCAELAGTRVKPGRCAAGHKALWHESWGGLPSEKFLTLVDPLLAGMRERLDYRETFTADIPVGTLSSIWMKKLGLHHDVVISGGAFDCHMGAVGAGIEPGRMVKVMGTSTCDIMVTPGLDKCVRGICGQVEGSVLPGMTGLEAGQSAFGDVYAWFRRFLSYGGAVELSALERDAAAVSPGELMAIDWLNGRRTPDANQNLSGALFGLTLGTDAPMVYRALVESTVFGARAIAERFACEGVELQGVTAIGGIAVKSPFVMQMCSDVMNMPIEIGGSTQACALGAAMFAATAAGMYDNIHLAMRAMCPPAAVTYTPQRNYDGRYERYKRLAAAWEREVVSCTGN